MVPQDRPGQVIFLNGVPNAGKTTLAETVQALLEEPYWHLSLDDFLRGYTSRHRAASNPPLFPRVLCGYLHSPATAFQRLHAGQKD